MICVKFLCLHLDVFCAVQQKNILFCYEKIQICILYVNFQA